MTCQLNYFSPYLHTGQNILNALSLRTFCSLTTRNSGSYRRLFTVLQFEPLLTWNFLRDLRKHTRNRDLRNGLQANSDPHQLSTLRLIVQRITYESTAAATKSSVKIWLSFIILGNWGPLPNPSLILHKLVKLGAYTLTLTLTSAILC